MLDMVHLMPSTRIIAYLGKVSGTLEDGWNARQNNRMIRT